METKMKPAIEPRRLVGPKYKLPIATRNGRPAWMDAPPRKRASHTRKESSS